MKSFKKFLLALPLALVVICGGIFVGCKDKSPELKFTANTQLKTSVDSSINYLKDNIYNKKPGASSWEQSKMTAAEVNTALGTSLKYYVEVGSIENASEVISVKLGDQNFAKDAKVDLSIGNNAFISDKAYYVQNSKLYVAAPVIAFETRANSKIVINGKEFNLGLNPVTISKDVTSVTFKNNAGTAQRIGTTNAWNVSVDSLAGYLQIRYADIAADDVVLTKKVIGGKLNSYGITGLDDNADQATANVGFYPVSKTQLDSGYQAFSYDYSIYVIGKGIAQVKLNIAAKVNEQA